MNYKVNLEDQQIRFPEIGTYGEPDWVTMNEDGSLIEDESEVRRNRNDKILFKAIRGHFMVINFILYIWYAFIRVMYRITGILVRIRF